MKKKFSEKDEIGSRKHFLKAAALVFWTEQTIFSG
jgi:hypothetical protein